ncbi:MAG: LysR family transcriptional regulator [Alphaproteobacteria bacterium]|nr:LysR family transcriptional regulator [Alphaproteobacteria bacterium]
MKTDLEIDLLRSFSAVAETKHFTRAAERLNCAQSAVSMQIKRLETLVGARLFDRTKRTVKLTTDGEVFRRYANRILRLNEETLAAFGGPPLQGRVRLGATDTSMCFLPPILSRFAQRYPLIELEIRCDRSWESLDALDAGEIDLALVTQPCGRRGGTTVHREPLVWAAAQGTAIEDVDPLPLALFGPGCIYREATIEALDTLGRPWRHAYNSPSRDGLDVAVDAGLAVTVVPENAIKPNWRILDSQDTLPPLPEIELLLYHATGEASAPVETLGNVIVDMFANTSRAAA